MATIKTVQRMINTLSSIYGNDIKMCIYNNDTLSINTMCTCWIHIPLCFIKEIKSKEIEYEIVTDIYSVSLAKTVEMCSLITY